MSDNNKIFNRSLRVALYSLSFLMVLSITVVSFLHARFLQPWWIGKIEPIVSTPQVRVKIDKLDLAFPFNIRNLEVHLEDRQGLFASFEGVSVDWKPWQLAFGECAVEALKAEKILFLRNPEISPPAKKTLFPFDAAGKITLPELTLPLAINIHHLALEDIALHNTPHNINLMLTGSLRLSSIKDTLIHMWVSKKGEADKPFIHLLGEVQDNQYKAEVDIKSDEKVNAYLAYYNLAPLEFTLKGKGSDSQWRGSYEGRIGAQTLSGVLQVSTSDQLFLSLEGQYEKQGADISTDYSASIHLSKEQVRVDALSLKMPRKGEAYLKGTLDFQHQNLDIQATASFNDVFPLYAQGGQIHADFVATGSFLKPDVNLSFKGQHIGNHVLAFETMVLELTLHPTASLMHPTSQWLLMGRGSAPLMPGTLVSASAEDKMETTVEVHAQRDFSAFTVKNIHVATRGGSFTLTGNFDQLKGGAYEMLLTGAIHDFASDLSSMGRLPSAWHSASSMRVKEGSLLVNGKGSFAEKNHFLKLSGELKQAALEGKTEAKKVEDSLSFHGILNQQGGITTIDQFHITGNLINGRMNGVFHHASKEVSGQVDVKIKDLAFLSPLLATPLGGMISLKGNIQGSLMTPVIQASLSAKNFHYHTISIDEGAATLTSARTTQPYKVSAALSLKSQGATVSLASDIIRENQTLYRIKNWRFEAPQTRLDLENVAYDQAKNLVTGTLRFDSASLASWTPFFHLPLKGKAAMNVFAQADGAKQSFDIETHLDNLRTSRMHLSALKGKTTIRDLYGDVDGSLVYDVSGLTYGTYVLKKGHIEATDGKYHILGEGKGNTPYHFDMSGRWKLGKESKHLTITSFKGSYEASPIKLLQTLDVTLSKDTITLKPFKFMIDKGKVQGEINLGQSLVKSHLTLVNFPLSFLKTVMPIDIEKGNVDAQVDISGPKKQPKININMTGKAHTRKLIASNQSKIIDVSLKGAYAEKNFIVETQLSIEKSFNAKMRLTMPVQLSFAPFNLSFPPKTPLGGKVVLKGSLQQADFLLPAYYHIDGQIDSLLHIGGVLDKPLLNGHVDLSRALFQDFQTGITLKDIDMTLNAKEYKLTIASLKGRGMGGGSLTAQGFFNYANGFAKPSVNMELQCQELILVKKPELNVQAQGNLSLKGQYNDYLLSGSLFIDPLEYSISGQSLTTLKPVEFEYLHAHSPNAPKELSKDRLEKASKSVPLHMALDVALSFPGKVFIYGRGLESYWTGTTKIKGTSQKPSLSGNIQLSRGTFTFLDKEFKFTQGQLIFDGSDKINPLLDLIAQTQQADLLVKVNVKGVASNPQISLVSEPFLPQEEIISHLLFGQSKGQLSPSELIELARTVQTLKGGGSSFNLLGSLGSRLGFDSVKIKSGMGSGPTLSAGKYIGKGVYLSVDQNIKDGSTKTNVEIEMTKNLTLDTDVGTEGTGVGINYRLSY